MAARRVRVMIRMLTAAGLLLASLAFLAAPPAIAAAAAAWPKARFDGAITGFNPSETHLSAANVASLAQDWSVSLGYHNGSPVLAGGLAYLGCAPDAFCAVTDGAPAGSRFHPLAPARVLDTRNGTGGLGGPVGPGATIFPPIAGQGGVPLGSVTAVVLNVTVTQPTAETFLTVFPSGTTPPLASNLNVLAGQTVPNLVVARVGPDGKVSVYNNTGTLHVIIDVVGWFAI